MAASRTIAITGASGFLAAPLSEALKREGARIVPVDVQTGCNILDFADLQALPPFDSMVHLAARTFIPLSFEESRSFYEVNLMGTVNCLEVCKQRRARLVFASTYVYGTPNYLPVDEKHPVEKWNPYSTSKILGEELCEAYSLHFGISVRILRLFNLYGPGHATHFLIPKIVEGVRAGRIDLASSKPKRDYVYVKDVVDAFVRCVCGEWEGFERFNVGTGKSYSVEEVVGLVQKAMGREVPVQYQEEERPGEVMEVLADISLIRERLGWSPRYDLEEGLRDYLGLEGNTRD